MSWLRIGFGVGIVVVVWYLWSQARQVPLLEATIKAREAEIARVLEQKDAANEASEGYQNELKTLREAAAAAPPGPAVRLCRPARAAVVSLPAAQPGPAPATAAAGVVPGGAESNLERGPDIGPKLRALALRADELSAQLRGCLDHDARMEALAP